MVHKLTSSSNFSAKKQNKCPVLLIWPLLLLNTTLNLHLHTKGIFLYYLGKNCTAMTSSRKSKNQWFISEICLNRIKSRYKVSVWCMEVTLSHFLFTMNYTVGYISKNGLRIGAMEWNLSKHKWTIISKWRILTGKYTIFQILLVTHVIFPHAFKRMTFCC